MNKAKDNFVEVEGGDDDEKCCVAVPLARGMKMVGII